MLLDGVSGGLAGAIGLALADVIAVIPAMPSPPSSSSSSSVSSARHGPPAGASASAAAGQQGAVPGHGHGQRLQRPAGECLHRPAGGLYSEIARYIFGQPVEVATVFIKITGGVTLVNSLLSTVCAVVLYLALEPALRRAHLLPKE